MKRKKVIKQRGSKTHGYGSKKKHRGGGSKGGKGRAGTKDQKKLWLWKKGESLGKRGFKSLRDRGLKPSGRAINLRDVASLAGERKEIDLKDYGYDRVLGSGNISRPLSIRAKHFSAKAKDKVENAGGKVIADG